jgi:chromosome partitioning protein
LPPKVITIANQKGGTGKTTLAALLAYGLALRGREVLILDLDPQSHLSSLFLKINEIEKISEGVLELAGGLPFRIRNVDLGVKGPGKVGLVPSGINYIMDVFRGKMPAWDIFSVYKRIEREPSVMRYDYVICDTPPELFPPTIWGLYAADYLIVPSNLEELSIVGTKIMFKEVVPEVMMTSKKDLKVLGVAIINVTKKVSKDSIEKLEQKFMEFLKRLPSAIYNKVYKRPFFKTIIHRQYELTDLTYRPRRWEIPLSRIVNRLNELKDEVINFTSEVEERIGNFEGMT